MNRRKLLKTSATTLAGLMALPSLSLFLKGCGVDRISDYQPLYLSEDQFDTVYRVADLILPKTSTPGASDAGVAPYIDLLFDSYYEEDERNRLTSGLNQFMNNCQLKHEKPFTELIQQQQLDYLQEAQLASDERPFLKSLKGTILWAFFTSEVGMKSMNYQPVPGKYDGCIEINSSEKTLVGNR